MSDAPVFLFDGMCVLCSRSVAFVIRHERAPLIRFVAIQSEEGRAIARDHSVDPDDPETFLFVDAGIAHRKAGGVVALMRHLRQPWQSFTILSLFPRAFLDWGYDRIARNRYRLFGRREVCLVPDVAMCLRLMSRN